MQPRFVLATLLALALVTAACTGGDDGPLDSSPTATATAPSLSAAQDFAAVVTGLDGTNYNISYDFTTQASGVEFSGALTWIRAADGRERFETSSEQGGEAFSLVVIRDAAGEQVTCFNVGGFESCFEGDDGAFADLPNPTEIVFQNVLAPGQVTDVRATSSREILGLTTTCYAISASGGTSEACIAEGNLLLAASWSAPSGDTGGVEATAFSTSVADEDFEPTVPVGD